jgi:excinuclease ABC subunit C
MDMAFDAKAFLATAPEKSGVYQMLNAKGQCLYVGKAKNLKKRLTSYFQRQVGSKTARLVAEIQRIDLIITQSEAEALLLESNLIKDKQPRFNVLLRDDKSYPFLLLESGDFPRLAFYRGRKPKAGQAFGPYPNAQAVRENMVILQRVFRLRVCEDSVFNHRDRPCIEYQIQRCSGPCVGLISTEDYQAEAERARAFLSGRDIHYLLKQLVEKMQQAAAALEYERAAYFRDQIARLQQMRQEQTVYSDAGDLDIFSLADNGLQAALAVLWVRQGRMIGSDLRLLSLPENLSAEAILTSAIPQYYQQHLPPETLILPQPLKSIALWQAAWLQQDGKSRQCIASQHNALQKRWLAMALANAQQHLAAAGAQFAAWHAGFVAIAELLALPPLQRIECFDISHQSGQGTVAALVSFTPEGVLKSGYRRYHIENITPGDDYAALAQAVTRRFAQAAIYPDLLLIDGGKGQVAAVAEALAMLSLRLPLLGITKNKERKAGAERFYQPESDQFLALPPTHPALRCLLAIRDEAHRFALRGGQLRQKKRLLHSRLEEIPGLGKKRRQLLLQYFGGFREVQAAAPEDLAKVPGIGMTLAKLIYHALHAEKS